MTSIDELLKWLQRKPLIFLRLPPGFEKEILGSPTGLSRFSWAQPRLLFKDLKHPTLCFTEMRDDRRTSFYVGVFLAKSPVATFDSRITIIRLQRLKLDSLDSLRSSLEVDRLKDEFNEKINGSQVAVSLTAALSRAIVLALATTEHNNSAIKEAASNIPGLEIGPERHWEQLDAVKTAMSAFGLSKDELSDVLEVSRDSTLNQLDSSAARVYEDNVIAVDTSVLPGFKLLDKDLTGHAVFVKGEERLDVYTANRGPLEEMLGVDLVYVNERLGSIIMVQYKMMEPKKNPSRKTLDWFTTYDEQFQKEVARMNLPPLEGSNEDYRIHDNPFFFKFVRRIGDGRSHHAFALSLGHLMHLFSSGKGRGPRGGERIAFHDLDGVYLRDSDLIGLIKSGYIGTHRKQFEILHPIIEEVAKGNRGLVLAWQRLRGHL
jgi:hypothetical protein